MKRSPANVLLPLLALLCVSLAPPMAREAQAQGFSSVSSSAPTTPTTAPTTTPAAASAQGTTPAEVAPAAQLAALAPNAGTPPDLTGAGPDLNRGSSKGSFEQAERVLVDKSERKLYLLKGGQVVAEYPVKLGLNPYGHKQQEGDFRTPEGKYTLTRRNPRSEFFLAIQVSYPNKEDAAWAKENGWRPGGLIMIHGQPNVPKRPADFYANRDWTDGCIALSNADMVDVWLRTSSGIPIEIRP
jgi:hypothetical protein